MTSRLVVSLSACGKFVRKMLNCLIDMAVDVNFTAAGGRIFRCLFSAKDPAGGACLIGCCAGLGLFLLRPGEFEYLWFAGAELGLASLTLVRSYPAALTIDFHSYSLWESLSFVAFNISWPTFIVRFLGQPRRRLYWTTIAMAIAIFLVNIPFLFQWISIAWFLVLVFLGEILTWAGILLLVWFPARGGDADARLLVAPTLLYLFAKLTRGIVLVVLILNPLNHSWWDRYNSILRWPFTFSVESLAFFVTQVAVLAIVVLRFARKSRDEELSPTKSNRPALCSRSLCRRRIPQSPASSSNPSTNPPAKLEATSTRSLPRRMAAC